MSDTIETEYVITRDQHEVIKKWRHLHAHGDQTDRYIKLNQATRAIAKLFMGLCPDSRDLTIALDHLEDARHWATRAISKNELDNDKN